MCEYCGCLAIEAIATLTREHDQALDHIGMVTAALGTGDDARLRHACTQLLLLLGPHTAVEEQALFPALVQDFPEQIAILVGEHASLAQSLTEAAGEAARRPGWEGRLEAALSLLREHIFKEQNGVFPAALSHLSPAQWNNLDQVRARSSTGAAQAPAAVTIPSVAKPAMSPRSSP